MALKSPEPHPHTSMRKRKEGVVKVFLRPVRNGMLVLIALGAGARRGLLR